MDVYVGRRCRYPDREAAVRGEPQLPVVQPAEQDRMETAQEGTAR